MTSVSIPKYRNLKTRKRDRAFVELNGQRFYLGKYNSPESKEKYHRLLAEWEANHGRMPVKDEQVAILELVAAYWLHVLKHYRRPDGTPTCERNNIRQALRPLKKLYGRVPVSEFGPIALKAVRQKMVDKGWCRTNVNKNIGRIKRMFKWGVENEMIDPRIYHGVSAVSGLRYGRTEAYETDPVKPVPDHLVDKTLEFLVPTLQAMVTCPSYDAVMK